MLSVPVACRASRKDIVADVLSGIATDVPSGLEIAVILQLVRSKADRKPAGDLPFEGRRDARMIAVITTTVTVAIAAISASRPRGRAVSAGGIGEGARCDVIWTGFCPRPYTFGLLSCSFAHLSLPISCGRPHDRVIQRR